MPNRIKAFFRHREYWIGILTIGATSLLALVIVVQWRTVQTMTGYGYFGGFVVSLLGGATVLVPIPMSAVQFALGGVLQPWFGPPLAGPLCVGLICGLGESLGALSIYATGYSGAKPLLDNPANPRPGRISKWYRKLMRLLEKRGSLPLFFVSAVMNPFFYPTSLAYGASRFGVRRYFLICFAGKTIKCSLTTFAGYFGLSELFKALGIT